MSITRGDSEECKMVSRRLANAVLRHAFSVENECEIAKQLFAFEEELRRDIEGGDMPKRWAALRKLYASLKDYEADYDPYPISLCWDAIMTPIERSVWADIRICGLPFYMQYPVSRYIADFADPLRKIVIEADGARWHNPRRDAVRDSAMASDGWTVYRITGAECMRNECTVDDAYEEGLHMDDPSAFTRILRDWFVATSAGVVSAIGAIHYGAEAPFGGDDLARETLKRHCAARPTASPR